MGKVILVIGAAASAVLGFALWRSVERYDLPTSGKWRIVVDDSGEVGVVPVAGLVEERDISRVLKKTNPRGPWSSMREGDDLRLRSRVLEIPSLGWRTVQIRWEIRRGTETHVFNDPPGWRFWGGLGLIAASPLLLAALVTGVVALLSRRSGTPSGVQ
jgi:hypothetical protein